MYFVLDRQPWYGAAVPAFQERPAKPKDILHASVIELSSGLNAMTSIDSLYTSLAKS